MESKTLGAGNDTFDSSNSTGSTGTVQTLNAGDVLDGGTAGTDRLAIVSSITGGATLGAGVQTKSVEQLSVNAVTATTVEANSMPGVTDVYNSASLSAVTVTGLAALANVHVVNTSADTTVTFATAAVAGTADATIVLLNGAATTKSNTVTINGLETVNLVADGSASGTADAAGTTNGFGTTISSDALTTLNITGTAGVRVSTSTLASSATVTGTITSAAGADDVTVNAGGTTKVSVNMGAGNDIVRLGAAPGVLAATPTVGAWTVVGGDGTDTLVTGFATSATTTGGNISGFEAVRVTAGVAVALSGTTNTISTVTFDAAGGSVAGVAAGATVNVNAAGTSTVTNTTGWTGTADSITFNVGNSTTNSAFGATTLTADLIETVTVNNLARTGNTDARDITLGTSTTLKTLNINANGALTLTAAQTTLTTVNAAGVAGNLTYNTSAAAASITGGAGNDTLGTAATTSGADTMDGGAGNDSISTGAGADSLIGGAGADTLTGGTGADTMTGGDGADRFVFTSNDTAATTPVLVSTLSASDTITDFVSGTDKISITGAYAPVAFLGNFANIQAALAAQNNGDAIAYRAAFISGENNLYVFKNTNGTLNVDDTVIKLTNITALATNGSDLLLGSQGTGNAITLSAATAQVTTTSSTGATVTTGVTTNTPVDSTLTSDSNDTVSTTLANVAATAAVNAGGGTDTLALSIVATAGADGQATAAELANFVGFETITLANRSNTTTATNIDWDVLIAAANVADNSTLTITSSEDGVNADGSLATWGTKITAAALTNNGGNTGTNRKVNITGGSAQDSIVGGTGNDTLTGGAGNDRLEGGTGTNVLSGGDGDDAIVSTSLTDSIAGGNGNDTVTLITGAYTSVVGGDAGAADTLSVVNGTNIAGATVSGFESLTIATGGSVTMTVAQLAGFTTGVTAAGTETITLTGAGGTFTKPAAVEVIDATALTSAPTISGVNATGLKISGSTVSTITNTITLTGDVAADVSIVGGGANDVINFAHGATGTLSDADTITGGAGTDTLNVTGNIALTITVDGDFTDIEAINFQQTSAAVSFTTADATVPTGVTLTVTTASSGALTFNASADTTTPGKVSVTGGVGDDVLTGGGGADTLIGGAGADTLVGGAGADRLEAGDGNNRVDGGLGTDAVILGTGSNRIMLGDGSFDTTNADTVTGFNTGATASGGDVIFLGDGDLDAGGTTITLTKGGGAAGSVVAGDAVSIQTVAPGATVAHTANANILVVSGTTGTSFASALNGATVTGATTAAYTAVMYYDADLSGGSFVLSAILSGVNTVIEGADTEVVLLTGVMSAADYNSFAAGNFSF